MPEVKLQPSRSPTSSLTPEQIQRFREVENLINGVMSVDMPMELPSPMSSSLRPDLSPSFSFYFFLNSLSVSSFHWVSKLSYIFDSSRAVLLIIWSSGEHHLILLYEGAAPLRAGKNPRGTRDHHGGLSEPNRTRNLFNSATVVEHMERSIFHPSIYVVLHERIFVNSKHVK